MPEVTINNIVKKIIKNPEDNSERIYYFGSIPSNQLKSVPLCRLMKRILNKLTS